MKWKCGVMAALIGWIGVSGAWAVSQKIMYVQVPQADVRESKSPGSAVVAQVTQGAKLTVLAEEGVRYQVQLNDGKQGYISKLSVSEDKPSSGGSLGGGLTDDRDITERRTAASGRGLSEAAKTMAKNQGTNPNAVAWVEKMENMAKKITADDVKRFRKEGGLQ